MPLDYPSSSEGSLHIYQALIRGASKEEVGVAQRLHERSIYQNIEAVQNFSDGRTRVAQERLPCVTRVQPYSLISLALDATAQGGACLGLEQRIATREGDVGKGVGDDDAEELVHCHLATTIAVPRLRVVASWAAMRTSCQVDAGAETWAIHGSVLQDVEDS